MDRALDLERLAAAMGRVADDSSLDPSLPTAEELQRRMAQAEIALFLGHASDDPSLTETAWFLHGVASADAALDIYSFERQRQAFAVSAHIFDLVSQRPGVLDERQRQAFAAQVGFLRSGSEPNASAVGRRIASWAPPAPEESMLEQLPRLAVEVGAALLTLDPGRTAPLIRRARQQLQAMATRARLEDLGETIFGPTWLVVDAANDIHAFLVSGDADALSRADEQLRRAVGREHAGHDLQARWVAAHLRFLSGELASGSIWRVFPPDTPRAAMEAFTLSAPQVLCLWEPQRQLMGKQGGVSAQAHLSRRVVLSVPTSAGKTLMAQLLMVEHIVRAGTGVCYVAPQRSLGREVRAGLLRRLRVAEREIGRIEPDAGLPTRGRLARLLQSVDVHSALSREEFGQAPDADVTVMTPERLSHALRTDADAVLARYGMFVFDEAHQVRDESRGFVLEGIISYLGMRTSQTDHRLILLSAAMGNAAQVKSWVDPQSEGLLLESQWRGPRRLTALFGTEVDWDSVDVTAVRASGASAHLVQRHTHPVRGLLRLKPSNEAEQSLATIDPIGFISFRADARGIRERSPEPGKGTPNRRLAAQMAAFLGHGGPVLVVCNTRSIAQKMAKDIAECVRDPLLDPDLLLLAELKLGGEHPLTQTLKLGVAFHHAGLPTEVLAGIEEAVRRGKLRFLVSTSTLTDGVNLPVRTVVIHDQRYQGQLEGQRIEGARLVNAIGRAGRAAIETEGWVVMSHFQSPTATDFSRLSPSDEDLNVKSPLVSAGALESMELFEQQMSRGHDALASAVGRAADFQSLVWFVLAAAEDRGLEAQASEAQDILANTLAFQQLDAANLARLRRLSESTLAAYHETDSTRRRAWAKAGTSIASARVLDGLAERIVANLSDGNGAPPDPQAAIQLLDRLGVWADLLTMPERPREWRFHQSASSSSPLLSVSVSGLLVDWVSGVSFPGMVDQHFGPIADRGRALELCVDAIADFCEHYFAWLGSVLVARVNELLGEPEDPHLLCPELGVYIRYGVSSAIAVDLITSGIRSREVANSVARVASREGIAAEDLQTWLGRLSVDDWRSLFDVSGGALLDLLEYARPRSASVLRLLLRDGHAAVDLSMDTGGAAPAAAALVRQGTSSDPGPLIVVVDSSSESGAAPAAARPEYMVPASHQADLEMVINSGLDVAFEVQGTMLRLSLTQ